MKFTHRVPAPDGALFAPGAFDRQAGRTVPLRVGERTLQAKVIAVAVTPDGGAAELTLDVDGDLPELRGGSLGGWSIRDCP